jgi:hypothetical protein
MSSAYSCRKGALEKSLDEKLVVSQCGAERCVKKYICDLYVVYNQCINQMNTVLIPTNVD